MRTETVYAKLKTEVIPISENEFLEIIDTIRHYRESRNTVIRLLEAIFNDQEGQIVALLDPGDAANCEKNASTIYTSLIEKIQVGFSERIAKKFAPKITELIGQNEPINIEDSIGKMVAIADIKIRDEYRDNMPNGYKVGKTLDYYRRADEFPKQTTLDGDGYLVSGYANYLVAKMIDLDSLLCYNIQ